MRGIGPTLLVIAVAAGCGGGSPDVGSAGTAPAAVYPTTPPPRAPAGIDFFADYSRYLWHRRRLVVATTNHTSAPIEISSIALRTGHFDPLPAEPKSTTILPGNRVDLQVDFGMITSCTEPPTPPSLVEVSIADPSGGPITYFAPIDPAPLDEIRTRECARRRVTDNASIAFSPERSIDDGVMHTSIEVTRVGGSEPVRIQALKGSVIIAIESPSRSEPLLVLDADDTTLDLPVELFVARCEPHAVSQSTLTYELNAFVAVGTAEEIRFPVDVDDSLRADLRAMIDRCIADLGG